MFPNKENIFVRINLKSRSLDHDFEISNLDINNVQYQIRCLKKFEAYCHQQ